MELFSTVDQAEDEHIQIYTDNLRPDLRQFVYGGNVNTLDETEEAALLGESLFPNSTDTSLREEMCELKQCFQQLQMVNTPPPPPPSASRHKPLTNRTSHTSDAGWYATTVGDRAILQGSAENQTEHGNE